jgi:hypothetical protein
MTIPKCNQCDSMTINGHYCHETGCPNTNKVWDNEEEEWVGIEEDDWEDNDFIDDADCNGNDIEDDYWDGNDENLID